MADSPPGLDDFKAKLNALVQKAASGEGDFSFPTKGQLDGVAIFEGEPGQYDYLFTFVPEGALDDRMVEVHMFPNKNPRTYYDQCKADSLKPDPWDKIVGWVNDPDGYPNRNEYDDIRMCGLEEQQPYHVRWVQQKPGDAGGYFVRLETTYEAPKDCLKDYADALWNIVYQAGYYNPADH